MVRKQVNLSTLFRQMKLLILPYWRIVLASVVFICILLIVSIVRRCKPTSVEEKVGAERLCIDYQCVFRDSYSRAFADDNLLHLAAARALQSTPFKGELNEKELSTLALIESNPFYRVDRLTHSIPYLIPEAKTLLDQIGEDFTIALQERGIPPYRIIVTSLTRTQQQQQRLSKRNVNAASESSHSYGTTFDISWSRFDKVHKQSEHISDAILKKVLASILQQYQKAHRCYIKHEKKQACFHITAIKPIYSSPS